MENILSPINKKTRNSSFMKREDPAGSSGGDSDTSSSKDDANHRKMNLEISQLEMLRDILTYKAQVLRI